MEELFTTLHEYRWLIAAGVALLVVLLILRKILRGMASLVRRKKTLQLHPKLQKYSGRSEAEQEADRQAAERIIATSSTGEIAGYEIVRQVDAVFVEGLRSRAEAITALKATAAQRGANAIINVQQQHTAAGKCIAQGDAVIIRLKDFVPGESSLIRFPSPQERPGPPPDRPMPPRKRRFR